MLFFVAGDELADELVSHIMETGDSPQSQAIKLRLCNPFKGSGEEPTVRGIINILDIRTYAPCIP